jgi:hypothetical protein
MPIYERKTIDILISDDLRNVLKEIESESIVASLLLKKRHSKEELVDSPVNYISVSHDDKTKISYLTTDRMKSLDSDTYWTSNSRYKGKPGAFVSKLFKDIPSKEVEKFSNLFRTQSAKASFTFKVVDGDEIKKYYHYSSYASERGSLGVSCMKHDHCQKVLKLYTKNTDQVKMLIMLDDNNALIGRALLWDLESNKIMDRIYTQLDEDFSFHFKKWATENGYLYKSEQNWFNTLFFENLNIKRKELQLEFNLGTNPRKYPYMDTFKFVNLESGRLFNYIPENVSVRTLTSSDGGYHDGDHLRFDGIDKVFRYRNEAKWLNYLNIYTSHTNCNYSNVNETYILRENCSYDNELDDYIFSGEFEHLNNSSRIEEIRNYRSGKKETTSYSNNNYYDYSGVVEDLSPTPTSSISESINSLRDLIVDLDMDIDTTGIAQGLYRQWQNLSRNEQEEVLESVTEVVNNHQEDEDLQLEEEPTPF